ncbi:hypothetical protein [Pseudonocardia sp. KRD291]|uniref:hypothetical protein n=1 Tax=Pseudonocardia sp. KRD291 TaxID=2792007 RepID=UPI001C4A31F9|nr:hypothetical protein [Pseudonocardia sp. KRD291]MBW0106907.1 hypothetical protein [Pseudonocardia sp. KRD291]
MTRLDDIPSTSAPGPDAPDARPSGVVAQIRAMRPGRRVVVRSLLVAAAAGALVPIDWLISKQRASASGDVEDQDLEPGATSEFKNCAPESYDEEANNWWTASSPAAVCFGGWRRGSFPCDDTAYHREGRYSSKGETYHSTRIANDCEGRNAWRWKGYRCSDAWTVATFPDGSEYSAVTIAACTLDD